MVDAHCSSCCRRCLDIHQSEAVVVVVITVDVAAVDVVVVVVVAAVSLVSILCSDECVGMC